MTRKQAILIERRLRAVGVYKPYVSGDSEAMYIESYPLTAIVKGGGCDPEMGPFHNVKITDCSQTRIGADPVLTTTRVWIGQDVAQVVSRLLLDFHEPAFARAKAQDLAAGC